MPRKPEPKKAAPRRRRRRPIAPPPPPPEPPNGHNRARPAPTPAPVPDEIIRLGAPPTDPMQAQLWAYNMAIASLADAARDPLLTAEERRREMRMISSSAAKLLPRAALADAANLVKQSLADVENKRAALRPMGAKLEARPVVVVEAGVNEPDPPPPDAQH